jgi:hypothetical protein
MFQAEGLGGPGRAGVAAGQSYVATSGWPSRAIGSMRPVVSNGDPCDGRRPNQYGDAEKDQGRQVRSRFPPRSLSLLILVVVGPVAGVRIQMYTLIRTMSPGT